jgi:hypothetical protein
MGSGKQVHRAGRDDNDEEALGLETGAINIFRKQLACTRRGESRRYPGLGTGTKNLYSTGASNAYSPR